MTLFPESALAADQPTGLGTAMAGGKGVLNLDKTQRHALDYYPTPDECTRALMMVEGHAIRAHGGRVWEPCGRGGAIARVLQAHGLETIATDIVADPANQVTRLDLLAATTALAPIVVTNKPWALAEPMIVQLRDRLGVTYMASLLKTNFWQTSSEDRGRNGLWRAHKPNRRWDINWRVDFKNERRADGKKSHSTMNVTWFIWDDLADQAAAPTWGLLSRDGEVMGGPDLFTLAGD